MMRLCIVIAVLFQAVFCHGGTNYYMARYGTNTANGLTTNTPWFTLTKFGAVCAPGDTLYVLEDPLDPYDCNPNLTAAKGGGQFFSPGFHTAGNTSKGTAENPITISNYPGHRPKFINGNLNGVNVAPFTIGNQSYIKIFGMGLADCRGASISLTVNTTNCEVAYNICGPTARSNASEAVFVMADGAFRNWIHDNIFFGATGYDINDPTNQVERGDTCTVGITSTHYSNAWQMAWCVIEYNFMYHGGHSVFNPQRCVSNYFRGNIIRNPIWIDWPSFGQKGGHRCAGGWGEWNVFEENDYGYAGMPLMNLGAEGMGIFGPNNLSIREIFHHNECNGLTLYSKGVEGLGWFVTNNTIVHPTFVRNALGQKYYTNYFNAGLALGKYTNNNLTTIFLSGVTNSQMRNALLAQNGGQGAGLTNSIEFRSSSAASNPDFLGGTNWFDHISGDPLFANDTNRIYNVEQPLGNPLGTNARAEFVLRANSPCIDKAGWLTTCVGNGSGTSLTVGSSRYFWSGLTACNRFFPGSTIQLQGQATRVTVTAIDPVTHTLTLSTQLTWTDGQGVALAYTGTAPDFGFAEYTPPASSLTGEAALSGGATLR